MLENPKQISQFLSFHLTADLQAILPTEQLEEILNVDPSQIVPIFDSAAAVMGVYNRRGEVLWVVDLAYLLDLEAIVYQNNRHYYNLLVTKSALKSNHNLPDHAQVGLAVRQVGQLILCQENQIQPVSSLAGTRTLPSRQETSTPLAEPKLSFCLRGEKRQPDGKKLWVLDADKILDLLKNSPNPNP